MINLGYYNGKYGPIEEMTVPMNDRACFFGDGIYDATVGENHVIYLLEEHLDRFFRNVDRLKLNFTMTRDELRATLNEMIGKVDGCVMVYWQATRGTAMRAHAFPDTAANLWIMIKPLTMRDPLKRIALTEMEDKRFLYCDIKTLNLLPSVLAAQHAEEEGCYESVFHRGETVTECAHSNVHILKDGKLITHPLDCYILPGIARHHLIMACEALGIPVEERTFTLDEMKNADEVMTSSSTFFMGIADTYLGQPIGGKDKETVEKISAYLQQEYKDYIANH